MHFYQRTISAQAECAGVGVHSGKPVTLRIKPAPPNHGIKFKRTDLVNAPCIPALFKMVTDTSLATVLGNNGTIVSTVEHLMASFTGLSIDNALVEISAYEMPIMDGSAFPFVEMIKTAGITEQDAQRCFFIIREPLEISDNGRFVGVYPHDAFKISCTIEYDDALIQTQSFSATVDETVFADEISKARTFGFYHEYEFLKNHGLARGGSLENAVVIDGDTILNEDGLRFADEFVRHKVLDCIGDFSLLGMPLLGHVITRKSGHLFNHKLLQKIFRHKECWETGFPDQAVPEPAESPSKSLAL